MVNVITVSATWDWIADAAIRSPVAAWMAAPDFPGRRVIDDAATRSPATWPGRMPDHRQRHIGPLALPDRLSRDITGIRREIRFCTSVAGVGAPPFPVEPIELVNDGVGLRRQLDRLLDGRCQHTGSVQKRKPHSATVRSSFPALAAAMAKLPTRALTDVAG
jgi:hypothetical protein